MWLRKSRVSFRGFAVALAALIALFIAIQQPFGYSPDYSQYESFFYNIKNYFDEASAENRFEPGFFYTSYVLIRFIPSEVVVYGVLAAVSVAIKLGYVVRFSQGRMYFWAFAFFAFKFFPLHELTQLRASLAAAFLMAAFYYLVSGMKKRSIALCIVAVMFHYSALMVVPFMFMPQIGLKKLIPLAALLFIVLFLVSDYLIGLAGSGFSVFELYEESGYSQREINLISPVFFPEFFMIVVSLILWPRLTDIMRRVVMIEIMGFAMFYAFSSYGVVAVRGRELFSIFWIFFVAQMPMKYNKIKLALVVFVYSSIALSLYLYFLSDFFIEKS